MIHLAQVGIPYAEISGNAAGPTVLITAGMDGDEYAGIEAAYQLIEQYQTQQFPGRLIILPVVNVPGFEAKVSWNPLDLKFPRDIFPGSARGSASEQLIDWVWQTYGMHAQLWIDLHGGATHEALEPFVWANQTGNRELDRKLLSLLNALASKRTVLTTWKKPRDIARNNCLFICFEAGERGICDDADVLQHRRWVEKTLDWITHQPTDSSTDIQLIKKIHYTIAPYSGFWESETGILTSFDKKHRETLNVKPTGVLLWRHIGTAVQKGEVLLAVGEG